MRNPLSFVSLLLLAACSSGLQGLGTASDPDRKASADEPCGDDDHLDEELEDEYPEDDNLNGGEPGSTPETSHPMWLDDVLVVQGHLHAGDVDVFRIALDPGYSVRASTSGDIDTFGVVYDEALEETFEDDDSGDETNFAVTWDAEHAAYYIEVLGYDDETVGDYTLRIELL